MLVTLVLGLALKTSNALDREIDYHQVLVASIQVRSNDFEDLEEMAVQFSCQGEGISPHLEWTGAPEGTRSYALVATDWDAPSPGFRLFAVGHWVLFNIPTNLTEIPQDAGTGSLTAQGVIVGTGMGGSQGYNPPCPPLGQHQYHFRVYALDVEMIQPESTGRTDVLAAIDGHILAYGDLIGLRTTG